MKVTGQNKILTAALALLIFVFGTTAQTSAPSSSITEIRELPPGQTFEREMTGAETHRYQFNLKANEFFQVRAEQKGFDVTLKLTDESNAILATMDSPNGKEGLEIISFAALTKGKYILEVSGFNTKAEKGSYVITRQPARMANAADRKRVRIERLFVDGIKARDSQSPETAIRKWESALIGWKELKDGYLIKLTVNQIRLSRTDIVFTDARTLAAKKTTESMKSAVPKFEIAAKAYRDLGEKSSEADCLGWLGSTYSKLGESQKALDYLNQSLGFYREIGGKSQQSMTLNNIGLAYDNSGRKQKALDYYNQSLTLSREIDSESQEAITLSNIGATYNSLDEKQKALDYYDQSLSLRRAVGDKSGEVGTLNIIGRIYDDLDEKQKALNYFNQSLVIAQAIDDKPQIVTILHNIGGVYDDLGEKQKALDYYNQSLIISRAIDSKSQEVITLNNMGDIYDNLGEKQKALDCYNQGLLLSRAVGDKSNEASILTGIGKIYDDLGDRQKALRYYNQSLPLSQASGDKSQEAITLNNTGLTYDELGDKQKALDYFNQALSLNKSISDQSGEALTLNNIGGIYSDLGDQQKALEYYNQSLSFARAGGDKSQEANTLSNIGGVYSELKDKQKALEYCLQALPLAHAAGDKSQEAFTLTSIGDIYDDLNDEQKALEYFQMSLPISRAIGDKDTEAYTLDLLRYCWNKQKNPRLAVFYGKQAINIYQLLRSNISKLDKKLQKIYLKTVESKYRRLADLLIAQGRIGEAEQVLAMLKQEEYFDFLRRDDKVADNLMTKLALTPDETSAFKRYAEIADQITALGKELGELQAESLQYEAGKFPKQARLDELDGKLADANKVFNSFLDGLKVKFGQEDKRVASVESDTQALLKEIGQPRTVIISTIVGEDNLNLIVTTADAQRAHTIAVKAADLNKLVLDFREAVKNPNVDPRPAGKKLYDVLFPADLQKDLDGIRADTLVWSLDGTLRYVPMAALWDGEKYLVEKYNNSVITLASRDKLNQPAADRTKWQALGVGVSKEAILKNTDGTTSDFPSLAAVPEELCGVISDPQSKIRCRTAVQGKTGVIAGKTLIDDEFTMPIFKANLGRFPVVHIASHFALNAGNEADSYLLLGGTSGDQRKLSIADLREQFKTKFVGIDLLTLSACNTAMSGGAKANGVEVEGFGAFAQKQGAKSVLATLWSVADASTRDLMTGFYSRLETNPPISKTEALRQAQLALLRGTNKAKETTLPARGSQPVTIDNNQLLTFKKDANAPFAHPYYWSPFILIGNWK